MLSPGRLTDNVLPRQAEVIPVLVIRPCRCGMPAQEILSSPITVTLMGYMLWDGHLMAGILPRQARIRLYRYGTPVLAKPTRSIEVNQIGFSLQPGHPMGSVSF